MCGILDVLQIVSLAVEVIAAACYKRSDSAIEETAGTTTARRLRSITTVLLVHQEMSIIHLGQEIEIGQHLTYASEWLMSTSQGLSCEHDESMESEEQFDKN